MNRLLVIVVAALVIAAGAFAVVVFSTGGQQVTPPLASLGNPATPARPAGQPSPGGGDEEARARSRFNAWAAPMRGAGLTVEAERVSAEGNGLLISNLEIGGPPNWLAWQWSLPSARADDSEQGVFNLESDAAQTLTFTRGDESFKWQITPQTLLLSARGAEGGRGTTVTVTLGGVSLQDSNGNPPVTLQDGTVRFAVAEGEGLLPQGSTAKVQLSHLVLPAESEGPLGPEIGSLAVELGFRRSVSSFALGEAVDPWMTDIGALGVSDLSLDWGALHLTGAGSFGLDATGRPAGALQADVADAMTVLDGFNTVYHFDTDVMATLYGKLLLEMGGMEEGEGLPFTILFGDGSVVLDGTSRGMDNIVLGDFAPLVTPLASQ